jgi:hypothetical protein
VRSTVAGLLLASATVLVEPRWSFGSGYPSHDGRVAWGTSSNSWLSMASFETARASVAGHEENNDTIWSSKGDRRAGLL